MLETLKFGEGNWANKTDSTLAYSDQYGNFKAIPFDFTRATTATRVNKQGLIESVNEGIARIDYSDSTQGALLLEPQRTNLITYSEDFSQWSKLSSTVTSNSIDSPSGIENADSVNYSITSSNGYIRLAHSASQYITFYVKYNDIQWLMCYGSGLGAGKFIDIQNGVIGGNVGSGANVEIYDAGNGWSRIHFYSSSANITQFSIYAAESDGSYANITLSGSVYLWGAQAELGSYATSYIPTDGATATRNQEICNNATPEINSAEGVLYLEISALADDGTNRVISLSDGSLGNTVYAEFFNSTNRIRFRVYSGGTLQGTINVIGVTITDFNKVALRWGNGFMSVFSNGAIYNVPLAISSTPIGLNKLNFSLGQGSSKLFGNTKGLKIYNTALTDAQLQTLTTI